MRPDQQQETHSTDVAAGNSAFTLPPPPPPSQARAENEENEENEETRLLFIVLSLFCFLLSAPFLVSGSVLASSSSYSADGVAFLLCCGTFCGTFSAVSGAASFAVRHRQNFGENSAQIFPESAVSQARPGLISHLISSPYDYKEEAASLLNNVPRLDAKTIIDSANCFYFPYRDPENLEEIKNKLSALGLANLGLANYDSGALEAQISRYAQNMITSDYKALGKIDKAETSQALFYGFITALTKNPDHFSCATDQSSGVIEDGLLQRLKEMPQTEKDTLITQFNNHLISLTTALSDDATGDLAIRSIRELLEKLDNPTKEGEKQDWDIEMGSQVKPGIQIKPSSHSEKQDWDIEMESQVNPGIRIKPSSHNKLADSNREASLEV